VERTPEVSWILPFHPTLLFLVALGQPNNHLSTNNQLLPAKKKAIKHVSNSDRSEIMFRMISSLG
jgi:hypothetical protein